MRFVLRRLGFFVLTLWVAVTLNFLLPRLMPGNPALAVLGKFKGAVPPTALKALEAQFGLDTHQSLVTQYGQYLGDLVHGIACSTICETDVPGWVVSDTPKFPLARSPT